MRKATIIALGSMLVFLPLIGWGLDGRQLSVLKEAGIQDETIRLMIREKTIETGAFAVEEIVALKRSGIEEATIQMLIREQTFLNDRQPIVYGKEIQSVKFATAGDVIRLKQAGLSDEIIQAIILVQRSEDTIERQKAWNMLQSMGIIVDWRKEKP